MKYWTLEDFDRFCNAPIEYNDHYLFYIFIQNGCRRGEALTLTWNDIDFLNKTVNINKCLLK